MTIKQFIPLLAGILVPLSTFLNLQSVTVPGWTDTALSPSAASDRPVCHRSRLVLSLSLVSLAFGVLATTALFVRMLEKKIKWMTRLIIVGSWCQGLFALLTSAVFYISSPHSVSESYSEAVSYNAVSALVSLISAALVTYHHQTNQAQWYSYTLYELSLSQRQLTLLLISSLVYMTCTAALFGAIEGWVFEDALYWAIASYTTIGFGDIAPESVAGRVLVPPVTIVGIGLIGGLIWALRDVILELMTLQLASQYSKWLASPLLEDHHHHHYQHQQQQQQQQQHQQQQQYSSQVGQQHLGHAQFNAHLSTPGLSPSFPAPTSAVSRGRGGFGLPRPLSADDLVLPRAAQQIDETTPLLGSQDALRPEAGGVGVGGGRGLRESRSPGMRGHVPTRSSDLFIPSSGMLASFESPRMPRTSPGIAAQSAKPRPFSMAFPAHLDALAQVHAQAQWQGQGHGQMAGPGQGVGQVSSLAPYGLGMSQSNASVDVGLLPRGLDFDARPGGGHAQQTMTISRSQYLPQVTIVSDSQFVRQKVEEATRQALQFQITLGAVMALTSIFGFGAVFSWIEDGWSIWEGVYFAYCSIATIGYGDITLRTSLGRSVFIWFVFLAIGSWTYLGSMVAEVMLDQWIVTVDHIEKRVDRYERKAQLKKMYGKRKRRGRDAGAGPGSAGGAVGGAVAIGGEAAVEVGRPPRRASGTSDGTGKSKGKSKGGSAASIINCSDDAAAAAASVAKQGLSPSDLLVMSGAGAGLPGCASPTAEAELDAGGARQDSGSADSPVRRRTLAGRPRRTMSSFEPLGSAAAAAAATGAGARAADKAGDSDGGAGHADASDNDVRARGGGGRRPRPRGGARCTCRRWLPPLL
ncbi:hypothetical protein HK105_203821 [Polyrhizophydium stewartii]|uniref:Potassium channel domain-containing protein n=1 Tax=Polyrhizophydium stewartii TaxID=2732419 RepID=A0ABR4NB17_9FUNG